MYLIIHIVNLYTLNNERNQVTKSTTPPTLLIPFYSTKHRALVTTLPIVHMPHVPIGKLYALSSHDQLLNFVNE